MRGSDAAEVAPNGGWVSSNNRGAAEAAGSGATNAAAQRTLPVMLALLIPYSPPGFFTFSTGERA